jgi:hypothetical protein
MHNRKDFRKKWTEKLRLLRFYVQNVWVAETGGRRKAISLCLPGFSLWGKNSIALPGKSH